MRKSREIRLKGTTVGGTLWEEGKWLRDVRDKWRLPGGHISRIKMDSGWWNKALGPWFTITIPNLDLIQRRSGVPLFRHFATFDAGNPPPSFEAHVGGTWDNKSSLGLLRKLREKKKTVAKDAMRRWISWWRPSVFLSWLFIMGFSEERSNVSGSWQISPSPLLAAEVTSALCSTLLFIIQIFWGGGI